MKKNGISKEIRDAIIENSLKRERKGVTRCYHEDYGQPYFDILPLPKKPLPKKRKQQMKEKAKAGDIFWVKNQYLDIPIEKKYRHTAAISFGFFFSFIVLHPSRSYSYHYHLPIDKYKRRNGNVRLQTRYYSIKPVIFSDVRKLDEYEGELFTEDLFRLRKELKQFLIKDETSFKIIDWLFPPGNEKTGHRADQLSIDEDKTKKKDIIDGT